MTTTLPYGLRDVKLTPYTTGEALGSSIDLPNSRTMSFEETEEFEELRGDDRVVAIRGKGPSVDWELEAGGIDLPCYAVLNGGGIVTTGTGSTLKDTYTKKVTDARPYFRAEGQAISESGGDFHAILYKCKTTDSIGGELSDGQFLLTSCSGQAIGMTSNDVIYDLIANASAVATTSANPTGATAGAPGTFTPTGSSPPATLAALQALGALGNVAAWTTGQFIVLGNLSVAYWNGTAWVAGVKP